MAKVQARRINPIAQVTALVVGVLIGFEALVISGAFELQAPTVAKYIPWAYEPFLKLVGEHPDSAPRLAFVEETKPDGGSSGEPRGLTGFAPEAIPDLSKIPDSPVITNSTLPEASGTEIVDPATEATNTINVAEEPIEPVG